MSEATINAQSWSSIRYERLAWRPSAAVARRFAVSLTTVFVLFAPYLANLSRDYTRYCRFWRTSDTLLLALLLLALTAVGTLAAQVFRRGRLARLFDHVFLSLLGIGLLANLAFLSGKFMGAPLRPASAPMQGAWLLLAAVVGYSYGKADGRLVRWCEQLCLIALPVVPITFVGLLASSTYPDGVEPMPPWAPAPGVQRDATATTSRGGIYVFLFDEWSYERTFNAGEPLPQYTHLSAFARTATAYADAHAPGEKTEESIPGILLQTGDAVRVDSHRMGFERPGEGFVPAGACSSIFARGKRMGYHSALIGFALPYRSWLGNQVDVVRTYCYAERADTWSAQLGLHLLSALHYSPDPWTPRLCKQLEARRVHTLLCGIVDNARSDVHKVIREWPKQTMLFAHMHAPHMPALLNPDLTFRDMQQTSWREGDAQVYASNLAAMDTMIGEFLEALRRASKFEEATIVLTSDHTWRADPDWAAGRLQGPRTHVPLLVKSPGQHAPGTTDHRFETRNLGALIESLAAGDTGRHVVALENTAP